MEVSHMRVLRHCLAMALLLPLPSMSGDKLQLESGVEQVIMIELFTSEGCSSCPPAEKYLNSFIEHPGLWEKYIPLAFHVDYWDYLGWKDRYSRPEYSNRQRQYARQKRLSTVYTPAFVVNGSSWRPRFKANHEPAPRLHKAGRLTLDLTSDGGNVVFFPESEPPHSLLLNLAVLGLGLTTTIEAGENRGRTAQHEFVVLSHTTHSPSGQSGDEIQWDFSLPRPIAQNAPRYALVAWVSEGQNLEPMQMLGGYLPRALYPE